MTSSLLASRRGAIAFADREIRDPRVDWTPRLRAAEATAPSVLVTLEAGTRRCRILDDVDPRSAERALVIIRGEECPRWIGVARIHEVAVTTPWVAAEQLSLFAVRT